jgi:hypothetical protein
MIDPVPSREMEARQWPGLRPPPAPVIAVAVGVVLLTGLELGWRLRRLRAWLS